jgi:hypothetical protein
MMLPYQQAAMHTVLLCLCECFGRACKHLCKGARHMWRHSRGAVAFGGMVCLLCRHACVARA